MSPLASKLLVLEPKFILTQSLKMDKSQIIEMRHFGLKGAVRIKPRYIERYFFFSAIVTDKLKFRDHSQIFC